MESEKVENILIKKLARCGIRCESTFMQNTTSAETGTAQASRPDFIRGQAVILPESFQLRRPGVSTGIIDRLRKNVLGKWRAYVIVDGVRWVFPVAHLKKTASGK